MRQWLLLGVLVIMVGSLVAFQMASSNNPAPAAAAPASTVSTTGSSTSSGSSSAPAANATAPAQPAAQQQQASSAPTAAPANQAAAAAVKPAAQPSTAPQQQAAPTPVLFTQDQVNALAAKAAQDAVAQVLASQQTAAPAQQTSVIGLDDPVLVSLNLLGFTSRAEFISFFSMTAEEREVATCPLEPACVRVLREKNMEAFILPFRMKNPTNVVFDGWIAGADLRAKWGRTSPGTAVGSGVPPNFEGSVEGVTIRGFGRPPVVPIVPMAPAPNVTPIPCVGKNCEPTKDSGPTQNSLSPLTGTFTQDDARRIFEIDASVTLSPCPGEKDCWAAKKPDSTGNPQRFHLRNPSGDRIDGTVVGATSAGIPANFNGDVLGATLRRFGK